MFFLLSVQKLRCYIVPDFLITRHVTTQKLYLYILYYAMQFSAVSSFYNTLNKVHGVTKELLQINFMYIPAPNIITFERACVSLYTPFMRNEQKYPV